MKIILILILSLFTIAACQQVSIVSDAGDVLDSSAPSASSTPPTPPISSAPSGDSESSILLSAYQTNGWGNVPITIYWKVNSAEPRMIEHTAVHYDFESHPNVDADTTPAKSGYTELTSKYAKGQFEIPLNFNADIIPPAEGATIYFRAHAIVDGKQLWTEEKVVGVAPADNYEPPE